jgi:hypothetical protein
MHQPRLRADVRRCASVTNHGAHAHAPTVLRPLNLVPRFRRCWAMANRSPPLRAGPVHFRLGNTNTMRRDRVTTRAVRVLSASLRIYSTNGARAANSPGAARRGVRRQPLIQ